MELFISLEILGLDAHADGIQGRPQWAARGDCLCCKQPTHKRAAAQRFDPCGTLYRLVK